MTVMIIGGGVIGLCTAWTLALAGIPVTVLDRGEPLSRALGGNAGWVAPLLSAPAPVRPSLKLLGWGRAFRRRSTLNQRREALRALLRLGADSVTRFEKLQAEGVAFDLHEGGLLLAARTEAGLGKARELAAAARAEGYPGAVTVHRGAAARAVEPALAEEVFGVVHAGSERHVHPGWLIQGLRTALRDLGVRFHQAEVRAVTRDSGGQWVVRCANAEHRAHTVVIAAGIHSARLLAGLGLRVPLVPAKGYSITGDGVGVLPRHAVQLVEADIACSPLLSELRVSAGAELGTRDPAIRPRMVARIQDGVARYLRWRHDPDAEVVTGLRPSTPDSLPLLGPVPGSPGVFAATGHGGFGLTLAPATGAAVAEAVLTGSTPELLAPFAVGRFTR